MTRKTLLTSANLAAVVPGMAQAHVSEQGFVLLLPTGAYTAAGVAAVALTVLALFALPAGVIRRAFAFRPMNTPGLQQPVLIATSMIAMGVMALVITLGLIGPRDPLSNLMPLLFWTVGWVALVSLAGVFGNLWRALNPWSGLYHMIGPVRPVIALPQKWGQLPAVVVLLGFAAFLLADIAPDDPDRLARFAAVYWGATFAGLLLCGPCWLKQVELGHAIFAAYASLAPVRLHQPAGIGGPGWQLVHLDPPRFAGLFALTLLAVGSFDGINETFWWLAQIGVNPLEFPGRSAVIGATLLGLCLSVLALSLIFAATIWLGLKLSRSSVGFGKAFHWLGLSLLPIALVYHVAHYLTSFLVQIQYTIAALSDPFAQGADLLGIEPFRVTTGFFNSIDTVRLIWTTQAGLVVLGHVWSVLLSHRIALNLFGDGRRAAVATLPLSLFMIGYTFLGLWLLAAPKGA